MSSSDLQEDFQSYMDGGARRPKRGVRAAPKRSASPKRRPAAAASKRRVAPKRHPMASLYGGFFESLEGFANEVAADKKKKVEMYADEKKNPMTPLAHEATKGGAKKATSKTGVKKPKAGVKKPKTGVKKLRTKHHGGYEEEQYQEHQEHHKQEHHEHQKHEDFGNMKDAVDKVQQLLSGGYLHRRVAPKRRPASAVPKRRPAAAAVPKRRPAAAAAPKRRVVRSYA